MLITIFNIFNGRFLSRGRLAYLFLINILTFILFTGFTGTSYSQTPQNGILTGGGGRYGGIGGSSNVIGSGGAGSAATASYGGGSGGGGGITGGAGSGGGGSAGGAGGAGGATAGAAGAAGLATLDPNAGGGGGGGGAAGIVITSTSVNSTYVSGGAGGIGGGGAGGGGAGGGGAGGYGAIVDTNGATFTNSGAISGGNGGERGSPSAGGGMGGVGVYLGSVGSLVNTGAIIGGSGGSGAFVFGAPGVYIASGSVSTITNSGSITSGNLNYGINNASASVTLNNGQGSSLSALTYTGILPSSYNIIISANSYGQLAYTSNYICMMGCSGLAPGITTFGIKTGSVLTATTYSSVITGLSSANILSTSLTGTYAGGYSYSLVNSSGTNWNLVVSGGAPISTNILPGSTNLLSSLGSNLNPVLEGGVLKVDSASTVSTSFSIKAAGGKIDANGLRSVFSGNFTDEVGAIGKLTIANTGIAGQGAIVLSGTNTHSGGTEVQSGANLSIASSAALGSGTLSLVGSSTVPATLTTIATTTIANAITVSGDPVFSVAPTTTTTITTPITDGVSSGDVVVTGGGTLALTAVNTYTGSTTINSGATLALITGGSITTSSGLINNGAFDISSTTSGATVQAISGSGVTTLGAQNLTVANAAGNLSGVVGGTGGLNITGGTQALSGTNTFSGGVQVQSGAALSIASSSALGSGALALIGSATVPATLNITDTTTIANAITVAGDPVFNITTGTTTTVSSPITDGGVAGDVVVAGGGTLNLTAVNSYTGLTAIGAGSTLALTGSGSITPSVSVTNNGTLNVSGQTGNVALGGSFTQTSSGSLVMGFSPTSNQRLQIAGAAVLAGSLSLQATGGTYSAGKYTLLSANGVTGSFGALSSNLSSYTNMGYVLGYDANDVYLLFTPNVANTQQSLVNTASSLQSIYTLQNSVLANSLNYDCTEFGPHGICISVGGRNTAVSAANGLNNTSGLLIGAYRPHPNYRVGAYIDQNLSMNNAGSTVNLGNNTPVIGVFGAWNEHVDGTGTEVKVTAAYGQKNTTVTRSVVGTSEAGSGSSQLNSQGAQVVAKYGFGVTENVIVNPYAGIRYTQNNMGGYTEGTSSSVTAPLTYSALNTNATTALAGVGASYKVIPTVTTFASAGVETDTNTSNGTYTATNASIGTLTPVNFNANPVRTRPTATLGAYYDIVKNQRLGVTGIYRQEAYQAVSTTTVMATYTVGL